MKARWLLGLVLVIGVFVVAQDHTPAPGNETISASDLEADLRFLAGDEMAGRLTDTRGNRLAAEFIRSRFARLGLTAVGTDGSYFHHFRLVTTELGENNEFTIDGGRRSDTELGDSFYPDPSSGSGHATGPLVFVGFGIDAPSLEHDDYRTAQLDGAIVLMLNHEPGEHRADSVFDGTVLSEDARIVRKVLAAQARGATAVIVAPDARNHGNSQGLTRSMREIWPTRPPRVARYNLASWVEAVQIPVLHISARLADRLAREAGERFDELAERAERAGGAPAISLTGPRIEITTTVARHVIENRNVVGLIEGSDPHRRNEWIIISAHYDHDGAQGPQIFNGADDDASGVAALIEIAEAYAVAATEGQRPARSILLAAWNSEEQGLLGAWAYVRSPLHPLDDTVAVLNMDMIGRDEEIPSGGGIRFRGLEPQTAETNRNAVNILGYSRSPDLRRAATQANTSTALELRFRYDNNASNLLRRSDQWPFLYREVPAIFIHTGLHPDYHTERDRADKIRYPKMTRIVKLVHQLSWELAQDPRRPSYVQP